MDQERHVLVASRTWHLKEEVDLSVWDPSWESGALKQTHLGNKTDANWISITQFRWAYSSSPFFNPHTGMFIDFRERKKTSMWGRNISQLPPIHTPTGDWNLKLYMCSDQKSNPQHFWCTGQHSNQCKNPARAIFTFFLTYHLLCHTHT